MTCHGALAAEPTDENDGPPVGRTSYTTLATPDVASLAFAVSETLPPTVAPAAGVAIEPVGSVLSIVIDCAALAAVWPAASVANARRLYVPSASVVVSSSVENGALVTVSIVAHDPPAWRWNSTVVVSLDTVAESVTGPLALAGALSETEGALLSTLTPTLADVVEFFELR